MNRTMASARRVLALAAAPLVLAAALATAPAPAASAGPTAPARQAAPGRPPVNPAQLPVAFTRNDGQAAHTVRYLGQTQGVSIAFTATGVTLGLARGPVRRATTAQQRPRPGRAQVTLAFGHPSRSVRVTGASREPGTVNYFTGNNPARWHTRIPAYARIVYHNVWPGITATFTTRDGTLKYWFTLAPRARAAEIHLAYQGAQHLTITRSGALAITTPVGTLTDQAPTSTQALNGHQARIRSRYRLTGGTSFGYALARDSSHAVVTIDPGLDYSTFFGGSACTPNGGGNDANNVGSVQADTAGDLYLIGNACSVPTTPGAYQRTAKQQDGFTFYIAKFNPAGTRLIYSTFVGGDGFDSLSYGVVDGSGDVYVSGDYTALGTSADFPVTPDAYQTSPDPVTSASGLSVAFKLNPTGSQLDYSTYLSGLTVIGDGLAPGGALTVVGGTSSDLLPVTPGAVQDTYPGGEDTGYVARLNPVGTGLVHATYLGAPVTSQILRPNASSTQGCIGYATTASATNVAVDAQGATYIAGNCTTGFPTTPGAYQRTSTDANGDGGVLLAKLNPAGTRLVYSTYFETPSDAQSVAGVLANGIHLNSSGNAYLSVFISGAGSVPITPGAYASSCQWPGPFGGCASAAEFSPTGGLIYSTYIPTTGAVQAVDGTGNAYITGETGAGTNLPTTPGAYSTRPGNYQVPFWIGVLAKGGGRLLYGSYFGGANFGTAVSGFSPPSGYLEMAPYVAGGNVYLGGVTTAPTFPTTPGAYQTTYPNPPKPPKPPNTGFAAELTLPSLSAAARHGGYKPPRRRAPTPRLGRPLPVVALGQ